MFPHTPTRLKTLSILWPEDEIPAQAIKDIILGCRAQVARIAAQEFRTNSVTVRALQGEDLQFKNGSGTVINDMSQASNSSTGWNTMTVQAGTDTMDVTIPTDIVVGIYGCAVQSAHGSGDLGPVVSAVRYTVGQSLVQQHNLYPIWQIQNADDTESVLLKAKSAYFEQPILIRPSDPLKIEDYTLETSENYNLIYLGWVGHKVEKGPVGQPDDMPFSFVERI